MKKLLIAIMMFPAVCMGGTYTAYLASETGLAYNKTFPFDLTVNGVQSVHATAAYSSATLSPASFTDGSTASGSIVVQSTTGLSAAYASDFITVLTTTGLTGLTIITPGYQFVQGRDWAVGPTISTTAFNIATALKRNPALTAASTAGVITVTARAKGSAQNQVYLISSDPTKISIFTPTLTAGADDAVITINGASLQNNKDWFLATTASGTASSITSAITAKTSLSPIAASRTTNTINLTGKGMGSIYNYAVASSTPAITATSMSGGALKSYAIGSSNISLPAHGLTLGLPVLYSSTASLPPLSDQTTYYVSVVDANNVKLATTPAHAVAKDSFLVITGSNTGSSYTLTPLPISGAASFKWQYSDNGSIWNDVPTTSVTFASPYPAAKMSWDFNDFGHRYIRINALSPAEGGLSLSVPFTAYTEGDYARKTGATFTGSVYSISHVSAVQFDGSGGGLTDIPPGIIDLSTVTAALAGKLNNTAIPNALVDLSTVTAALADKVSIVGGLMQIPHYQRSVIDYLPGPLHSIILCENCSITDTVCVGTGPANGSWAIINTLNPCQ